MNTTESTEKRAAREKPETTFPEFLRVKQVARKLGVSERAVEQMISDKKVGYYQPGRVRLFRWDEVMQDLRAHRVPSVSEVLR